MIGDLHHLLHILFLLGEQFNVGVIVLFFNELWEIIPCNLNTISS